jgi:hypothetical protein
LYGFLSLSIFIGGWILGKYKGMRRNQDCRRSNPDFIKLRRALPRGWPRYLRGFHAFVVWIFSLILSLPERHLFRDNERKERMS